MSLKDIKTLSQIAEEHDISIQTLHSRLKNLKEGEEYRKLGKGQSIILSKEGAEKIINKN